LELFMLEVVVAVIYRLQPARLAALAAGVLVVVVPQITEVLEQLTLVAAVAAATTPPELVVLAAPALLSSVTLATNVALAARSHRLVDTPTTHLHRPARLQHKENLNGTFCKSC